SEVGVAIAGHHRRRLLRQAVAGVELEVALRREAFRVERDGLRRQIRGLAADQRRVEPAAEPAGETYVIRMEMCREHARDALSSEGTGEDALPGAPRDVVIDPGVDDGPSFGIFQEVDVDVVELERKRHPHPQETIADAADLTGRRRVGPGEMERPLAPV